MLKPAERSFQEAIVAVTDGDQTVARIRFRQARDSFEDAFEMVDDSADDLFSPPLEVDIKPDRELPSTTLAELPVIPETAASELADDGIETVEDLDPSNEPPWTPPCVVAMADTAALSEETETILTTLSWWHNADSYEFDSPEAVSRRQQQSDYGFNHTS
jgi:hypothetical protein